MIKIELTSASNGVIKRVVDTNSENQDSDSLKVYEIDSDYREDSYLGIVELLTDISADLDLDMGSDYDDLQIKFDFDWGDKFIPSEEEIEKKIKSLNTEIRRLKEIKKLLADGSDV
jgi:hypothetical protein